MRHLPRRSDNKRTSSLATEVLCRQTKLIGFGTLKSILASHMEMQGLKFDLMVIRLNLAKYFLAMICFLPFGMDLYTFCHCMLEVWICIFILILQDVTVKRLHWVWRDFGLLEGIEIVIDCGSVVCGPNVCLHYYMVISLWRPGRAGIQGFE